MCSSKCNRKDFKYYFCSVVYQEQQNVKVRRRVNLRVKNDHRSKFSNLSNWTSLPMCGFIAQLVEQRTVNAEVTGSNPVEALIFVFRLLLSNCLSWKIYCNDHSSLSSTTAVQK